MNTLIKFLMSNVLILVILSNGSQCSDLPDTGNLNKSLSVLFSKDIKETENLLNIQFYDYPADRIVETANWFIDINIFELCKTPDEISHVLSILKKYPLESFKTAISSLKKSKAVLLPSKKDNFHSFLDELYNSHADVFNALLIWLENSSFISKCEDIYDLTYFLSILNQTDKKIFKSIKNVFLENQNFIDESKNSNEFINRIKDHIRFHKQNTYFQIFIKTTMYKIKIINICHGMLISDLENRLFEKDLNFEMNYRYVGIMFNWLKHTLKVGDFISEKKEVFDFWVLQPIFPKDVVWYIFQLYPRVIGKSERLDLIGLYKALKDNYIEKETKLGLMVEYSFIEIFENLQKRGFEDVTINVIYPRFSGD